MKAGVMLPQAKELLETWREAWTDLSLQPSEGEWSCQQLDFRSLLSRTVRQ